MQKNSVGRFFFSLFWIVVITPILAIWQGWAFVRLWEWFIMPFGVKQISMAHSLGLCTTLGLALTGFVTILTHIKLKLNGGLDGIAEQGDYVVTYLITGIVAPAVALLYGYVYHYFM